MSQEAIKPVVSVTTGTTTSKVAPAEAPKVETKETPVSDPRLEQLAKRERAFRAQQRDFQKQQAEFKAQQEKQKAVPDTSWKDRIKTNFLDVAAEAGLSHEAIAQSLMNHTPESVEIKQLRAEMAAIKSMQAEALKKSEEGQSKAYQSALKQVARDVQITTHGNDSYELINSKGKVGQDAVVAYIDSTYQEDGILLSAEEAAKEVEDYLLEEAITLAKLKKVQAKLTPPEEKKPEQKTQNTQKTQTLTQQASTSTPTRSTSAQRRERAILAMQGLLNK